MNNEIPSSHRTQIRAEYGDEIRDAEDNTQRQKFEPWISGQESGLDSLVAEPIETNTNEEWQTREAHTEHMQSHHTQRSLWPK